MLLASASRTTFSIVRGPASCASTTHISFPRCNPARTPATPITTFPARTPSPNSRTIRALTRTRWAPGGPGGPGESWGPGGLPALRPGSQPPVLAVAAGRQRQVVLVHDRLNRFRLGIGEDAGDAGRRQRQLGEPLRVGRPRDDVDALAVELVDDSLDARALQSHARADRIDAVVA